MIKHGLHKSKEYRAWIAMRTRCYNKNTPNFHNWGGKGIRVCDEWLNSFVAFYKYIGPCPAGKMSLDRIDSNKDYEPGNVRWANYTIQLRNQAARKNKKCIYKGVKVFKNRNKPYNATITIDYRTRSLGYYKTPEEAALAYNKAATELFGSDAVLNVIDITSEGMKLVGDKDEQEEV